jgi:hypothetical protein
MLGRRLKWDPVKEEFVGNARGQPLARPPQAGAVDLVVVLQA